MLRALVIARDVCCGNTLTSVQSDDCCSRSELSVGFSRDRQVMANETAVGGLIWTNPSTTNLSSSSVSAIRCGMSVGKKERYRGVVSNARFTVHNSYLFN